MRIDADQLCNEFKKGWSTSHNLFALAGQSNTTGVQHSLELINTAHEHGWMVILDAAALAPTSAIDLTKYPADFVAISFYKMFGYPTGVGCLLARRSSLGILERPWFSGGTVRLVSAFHKNVNFMNDNSTGSHFQDGTIPYSTLPAVTIGLSHLASIGMHNIGRRVSALAGWTLERMLELKHDNGEPLVSLYGPTNVEQRGGTMAMNLFDRNGRWIPHHIVEQAASEMNISIRTGCFCNPGIAEQALGYSEHSVNPRGKTFTSYLWMADKIGIDRLLSVIEPFETPFGMVRASVGIASNFDDVWRWMELLERFLDANYVAEVTQRYEEDFIPPTTLC
jgi:selenocysteine lyase/cysteine desulfurase